MRNIPESLDSRLEADDLLTAACSVAPGGCYVYGRYILEVLTGREPEGILLACAADTAAAVGGIARATGLFPVALKRPPGAFMLAGHKASERSITLVPMAGADIRAHLGDSGFTVEALALELGTARPRELIDPFAGLRDLAEGRLRAVSPQTFQNDPARVLLAAELSGTYGLRPDEATAEAMRADAACLAGLECSRAWRNLARLFAGSGMSGNARFLERSGALAELLPELAATFDVPQNYYHHLGVWEHTLEVLDLLEKMLEAPERQFPAYGSRISCHLARSVQYGVDRRAYLGFAALIHDIGKPDAMSVEPSGRIRFQGHQEVGGRLAAGIASRLGLPRAGRRHLEGLVRDHMRLGFLLKEGESANNRLAVVRELGDRCVEVVALSLADRMATRGEASTPDAMDRYKRMASRVLRDYFWDIDCPTLVNGGDVMLHAGVAPGPEVGAALFKARVAQREALIAGRRQALEFLAPDFKGRMNR